ncbi:MAG: AAA family ATPase [Methanomassiliicoccaceae archaeon]|jgi:BioD-like phosphotransacetylase family protein|nr:AAA family ATPase [Methanomassiliicoccaceae archaeon]
MKNVYLASVGARSGKSVISLGLAMNYPGKVGFYKPFRESLIKVKDELMDQDASLMAEVLKLEDGKKLSPFTYDIFEPASIDDIKKGYKELSKGKEFMIIEGSKDFTNGWSHKLSHLDIAEVLNAPIILVSTSSLQSIDTVFMFRELCEQRGLDMLGIVLNKCSDCPERKLLEERGIKVLGEVPLMPELRTFRVSEISEKMDAKVIAGAGGMDNIVETMLVGAMSTQTAIRYMRRSRRKAVITGGDRTEIQLAALSTDTACMIVTGGIRPSHTVLSRANELNVPVLITSEDTLHVTETIEHLIARIDPKDKGKIELVRKNVRSGIDLNSVWR